MALTRKQFLINLHTSGTTTPEVSDVKFGEIIVQHNATEQALYTKYADADGDEHFAKFVTSNETENLKTKLSELSGVTATLSGNTEVLSGVTKTLSGDTAALSAATVELSGATTQLSGVTKTLSGDTAALSAATVELSGVTKTLSGNTKTLSGVTETLSGNVETLSGVTATLSGNTEVLSGVTKTLSGDVETLSGVTATLSGNTEVLSGVTKTLSGDTEALSGATVELSGVTENLWKELGKVSSANTYTIHKLEDDDLSTNEYEKFELLDGNGEKHGDYITIYKDNAFVTAKLVHSGATYDDETGTWTDGASTNKDVLALVYKNSSGATTTVDIDVAQFLKESEFSSGLTVTTNGEVMVKVANSGDSKYLTVTPAGLYIHGIDDAISTASNTLANRLTNDETAISNLRSVVGVTGSADTKITIDNAKVLTGTTVKALLTQIDSELVNDITVASPLSNFIDEESETDGVSTLSATSETIEVLSSGYTSTSFVATETTDAVGNKVTASGVKIATNSTDVHDLTFDFSELVIDCGSY